MARGATAKVSTKIKRAGQPTKNEEARQTGGTERLYDGVMQNHGASPLSRWVAAKQLSEGHKAAIAWCMKRWDLVGHHQSTTASYGERTDKGNSDGESGRMILNKMEARDDLARVCGGIGMDGEFHIGYIPRPYWNVFENCIRFDQPAGTMGSSLGHSVPSIRALTTVQFVADVIVMNERLQY